MASFCTPALGPKLRALAAAFIPETLQATPQQWEFLEATIDAAVRARPALVGRQLAALIRLLDGLARLRYGRGLARLDASRCHALLAGLAASRLLLLRRGIWGLRTLIQMGWYTQEEVTRGLGYRPSPAGWGAPR